MTRLHQYLIVLLVAYAACFQPVIGQQILETVLIGQDQGIAHRNVEKVIRDQQGYFYLFMPGAIQRYDGWEFVDVDISILTADKVKTANISQVALLEDGSIVMVPDMPSRLFVLRPHTLRVESVPFQGQALVSDGKLYSLTTIGENTKLRKVQLENGANAAYRDIVTLPFKPTQYFAYNGEQYVTSQDSAIYQLQDGRPSALQLKGRLIANEQDLLLWKNDGVHRLENGRATEITALPTMNLAMLKKDQVGNVIASYSINPRLQSKLYVLTPELDLRSYDNMVGVSKFYRDFWTDDASYKWMLVGYNAIQVVNVLRDGVSIIAKNKNSTKGKFGNVVGGIAIDPSGTVFYSKESRGIFKIDSQDSVVLVHSSTTYENNYRNNERFYYSPFDEYFYNYCYRYDGTTDLYQSDFESTAFVKKNVPVKIVDLFPFADNKVLIAGYQEAPKDGRLCSYDFKTETFSTIRDSLPLLRSIYYDSLEQTYWIGTRAGLYIMNDRFETVATLDNRQDENTRQFLTNDYIIMVCEYAGKMLVATYGGGLYVINKDSYKLERTIERATGLTNNSVVGIMPDDIGNCWITTFNGVNILDSSLQVIQTIYDHQGLSDREYNSKAIAKDVNGHIYAGSINGVTRFEPEKILSWKETHGLDITSVRTHKNGNSTELPLATKYTITNDIDSVTVSYQFPDYYRFPFLKGKVQFDWDAKVSGGTQHDGYLVLTNLKPGTQHITATASTTQTANALSIEIKRDYTLLWYLLGVVGGVFLISYLIIRYNKQRETEKTTLNQQIAELQLTSLQSQMNPHFIFNALGAIQYFIQTHDAEKADEYLSNFAMLMRRILESSKSKYISLKNEIDLLRLYIGLEAIRFENMFQYDIILDDDLDIDINVPPMIIQPYIENAINHGIYNLKDRSGKLEVRFVQVDENTIECIVTDNGVGRKRAQELRTKRHKSRGMQIVKERIDTINTAEDLNVSIAVNDILRNGDVAGTEAIITIKEIQ